MRQFIKVLILVSILAGAGTGCVHRREATTADLVRYGVDLARDGYWHEAAVHWKMALEKDPDNVAALNNIAIAAEAENKTSEARRFLEKAYTLRPESREIKMNLKALSTRADKESTRETEDNGEGSER